MFYRRNIVSRKFWKRYFQFLGVMMFMIVCAIAIVFVDLGGKHKQNASAHVVNLHKSAKVIESSNVSKNPFVLISLSKTLPKVYVSKNDKDLVLTDLLIQNNSKHPISLEKLSLNSENIEMITDIKLFDNNTHLKNANLNGKKVLFNKMNLIIEAESQKVLTIHGNLAENVMSGDRFRLSINPRKDAFISGKSTIPVLINEVLKSPFITVIKS